MMPTDPKLSAPGPMAPVSVTMITGTGTGDGGVPLASGLLTTSAHQPNIIVTLVSPVMAIAIRFANLFLTILVGLVAAGMTSNGNAVLGGGSFVDLVQTCAALSVPGAGLGLLKDCVTIFSKLEGRFPLLTGSV